MQERGRQVHGKIQKSKNHLSPKSHGCVITTTFLAQNLTLTSTNPLYLTSPHLVTMPNNLVHSHQIETRVGNKSSHPGNVTKPKKC